MCKYMKKRVSALFKMSKWQYGTICVSSLWLFQHVDQPLYAFLQTYDIEDKKLVRSACVGLSIEWIFHLPSPFWAEHACMLHGRSLIWLRWRTSSISSAGIANSKSCLFANTRMGTPASLSSTSSFCSSPPHSSSILRLSLLSTTKIMQSKFS